LDVKELVIVVVVVNIDGDGDVEMRDLRECRKRPRSRRRSAAIARSTFDASRGGDASSVERIGNGEAEPEPKKLG
jgi:hypothetical protein